MWLKVSLLLCMLLLGIDSGSAFTQADIQKAQKLVKQARARQDKDPTKAWEYLKEAKAVAPNAMPVLFAIAEIGFPRLGSMNHAGRRFYYSSIAHMFDPEVAPQPLDVQSPQAPFFLALLARYHAMMMESDQAKVYARLALEASDSNNACFHLLIPSILEVYPDSVESAQSVVLNYQNSLRQLLQRTDLKFDSVPVGDKYTDCLQSGFQHEVYIGTDIKESVSLLSQVTMKYFPHFNYTAPHLLKKDEGKKRKGIKIKLGIASAMFGDKSSVVRDFGDTMIRLSRDIFDITFIDIMDPMPSVSTYLDAREKTGDKVVSINVNGEEKLWLQQARDSIASLELDVLLYLDLTMSKAAQRLGMSRLAAKQVNTHGHPVSSGIDRSVMNYFVSWKAAELPYHEAKTHYTEELVFLPGDGLHQYYERILKEKKWSKVTEHSIEVGRHYFQTAFKIPQDRNWYLCMQKPFKRHPEFDEMIASILQNDPDGVVILHDLYLPSEVNHLKITERLEKAKADLSRIHFLNTLPHHVLMGLYTASDVVLDSYPFGGCTTTREAIEVGSIVVTLPSEYLGGRWSLAYFNQIGVLDSVASSKNEYVDLAVQFATNKDRQKELKKKILNNSHKLFKNKHPVKAWEQVLTQIHEGTVNVGEESCEIK
mmetsp:Transcript_15295/g.18564  ORF Transcript_15295/g.18564 Transcript_15295/m.18564 type:complete len:652 (+) Transcript_15295:140-2095(+)